MRYFVRRYKCSEDTTIFKVRCEGYNDPQLWGEFTCNCYWLDSVPYVEEDLDN